MFSSGWTLQVPKEDASERVTLEKNEDGSLNKCYPHPRHNGQVSGPFPGGSDGVFIIPR